jgi:outer membrane receptor protein involved in Fe transport
VRKDEGKLCRNSNKTRRLVGLTTGLATGLATGLMATTSSFAADTTQTLDELVVTSTGFGEPRATHAGNISKIDSYDIDFTKAEQPSELLNRVPGVAIEQGSGVEHLTAIRSPVLTGSAGAGSFLYLEDGVPMRAAGFGNVNALMDAMTEEAGGIEVVRGPGSALYGSNAEHGLINVLSRAPSLMPEASLTGWLGPHGVKNLDGTASTTVQGDNGTSQGFRGSFALNEDEGFRASSGYGQQKGQFRYDFNSPDTRVRATLTTMNLNQETAGYVTGYEAYKNSALYKTNPNPDAYRDAWAIRAAVRVEHDLGDNQTIALTPYMRTNRMRFLMHYLPPGKPIETNGHWSGGLLSSYEKTLSGGHKIILGFDTEYTNGFVNETQTNPTAGTYVQGVHYDYTVKALVLAPYLHTAWNLSDATQVTAGMRYEFTRYDYENNTGTGVIGRYYRPADRNDTFSNLTPKLGLTHKFNDQFTGFVNLARAARAPQTTDLYRLQPGQNPDIINSEVLDSLEVGARGKIGQAQYEVSTYFMKKKNYAFTDSASKNITDGKTKHMGIELEVVTPLMWNFDLAAAATYARHTYDFTDVADSIYAGNDIDTAPRTIANVRLGYNFADDLARLELEWVHMGSYETDAANLHSYAGHDLLNLRAEYTVTENLSVFGRLSNLLDTRYADRADYSNFSGDRYFPGEDRAIYAGATVRF